MRLELERLWKSAPVSTAEREDSTETESDTQTVLADPLSRNSRPRLIAFGAALILIAAALVLWSGHADGAPKSGQAVQSVPAETSEAAPEPTEAPTCSPEATEAPTHSPEPTEAPTRSPEPTEEPSAGPGEDDLRAIGSGIVYPESGQYLDRYVNVYVRTPAGAPAYGYANPNNTANYADTFRYGTAGIAVA